MYISHTTITYSSIYAAATGTEGFMWILMLVPINTTGVGYEIMCQVSCQQQHLLTTEPLNQEIIDNAQIIRHPHTI